MDENQYPSGPPKLSWHILNAAMCCGLFLLALSFSVGAVVALASMIPQYPKVFAMVPILLILSLNFGVTLLASIRSGLKTKRNHELNNSATNVAS